MVISTIMTYPFQVPDETESYGMVFEFAEGGTLQKHLSCHFDSLTWEDKYKLGLDITGGLKHLHGLGIIHKDLVILMSVLISLFTSTSHFSYFLYCFYLYLVFCKYSHTIWHCKDYRFWSVCITRAKHVHIKR